MNDNLPALEWWQSKDQTKEAWVAQIQEVRVISIRALAKPESLTMSEIQEVAMGFLMAASTLEKMASLPK